MAESGNHPVVIGVAQLTHRSERLEDAIEPLEMMERVARAAAEDAGGGAGLLERLDSVQVVNIMSWPYTDAPGALAERLGAEPSQKLYSAVGGETPQRLVNETAQAIVEGRTRLALIAGAEAMHSRRRARRLGELCSRMTQVAAGNRYAWFPEARTPEEITAVGPENRMVCFPYPKRMNAIMEVDQAA